MTLNGIMALILRYFTEFMYAVVIKQLLGPVHCNYGELIKLGLMGVDA